MDNKKILWMNYDEKVQELDLVVDILRVREDSLENDFLVRSWGLLPKRAEARSQGGG
jgi:hypothetical protein